MNKAGTNQRRPFHSIGAPVEGFPSPRKLVLSDRESHGSGVRGMTRLTLVPLAPSCIHLEATGDLTNRALDSDGLSFDLPMFLGRVY